MQQRLTREDAVLVLIDFQENLMPPIAGKDALEWNTKKLIRGCKILGVPIIVTTQYAKGLGQTVKPIADLLEGVPVIDKKDFSAWPQEEFRTELERLGRRTVILAGIEAHVCVMQTALDLLQNGYNVFLATDCTSSRDALDKKFGDKRLIQAGAVWATSESVVFELLGGANREGFKDISNLMKEVPDYK